MKAKDIYNEARIRAANAMSITHDIKLGVFHCAATQPLPSITRDDIDRWHRNKGWNGIGYHLVVHTDGSVHIGRDLDNDGIVTDNQGAHVKHFNKDSIGVCWIGGVDENGNAEDNRTPEQVVALRGVAEVLVDFYAGIELKGHRDLSPDLDGDGEVEEHEWLKECPCYDVEQEYKDLV